MTNELSFLLGDIIPEYIREENLLDVLKPSFENHPYKTAFIFQNKQLTYEQLDVLSNRVAAHLIKQGIKPGDRVGLWYPRGIEIPLFALSILKCGAAYLPFDIDMPRERVTDALEEAKASCIITKEDISFKTIQMPPWEFFLANDSSETLPAVAPHDLAYIIFTSGSTGKPKGIPIQHRQIAHLVRSEQHVLQIRSNDKVYQGFSVSFDMWCEEVWISLFVGATIWMADAATAKSIDELSEVLRRENITVLHAVPSLLAVIHAQVPSIRLVNSGGEACNRAALYKWAVGDRIFFNSYGPTETTVSATFGQLHAGDPIHIGKPLPNYHLAVVDENMNPVAKGMQGELVIACPGTSIGYLNREALTKEKFLVKPASLNLMPGDRIYRTGDAVILLQDNTIQFKGRIDDQVKIRGYRIELDEINSHIQRLPHITASAVVVHKDGFDQDALVAYVVLDDPSVVFQEHETKQKLAEVMPLYMIPAVIEVMQEMPRLPSGKINKKLLPPPASFLEKKNKETSAIDENASLTEKANHVLKEMFGLSSIGDEQDFFNDLGGHSMLAAIFVSRLREEYLYEQVSLKDIYTIKPIGALMTYWEEKNKTTNRKQEEIPYHATHSWTYYSCWLAQSAALLLIYGLFAFSIFFPFLNYYYIQVESENHLYAALGALASFFIIPPLVTWITIALKWMVVGKFKEGDYPLWGKEYFKWWFIKTLDKLNHTELLSSTPLYNYYLRWLGVKIHPTAQLSLVTMGAEDLVEIDENASISSYLHINNAWVEKGLLKMRRVHIGKHTAIGTNAVLEGNTVLEDWSELKDLSCLSENTTMACGEIWEGSQAVCIGKIAEHQKTPPPQIESSKVRAYKIMFAFLMFCFPIQFLVPLLPSLYVFNELDNAAPEYNFNYFVIAPIVSIFYLLIYIFFSACLIRLLQSGIKAGNYSAYSFTYIRKWLSDQIFSLTLIIIHPIFASIFIGAVYRLMGAKVGKNTEISTASNVSHAFLEIGDESFIADAVALGESDVRHQTITLEKTTVGSKTFIGNSALVSQGYRVPDNTLIGVLSVPPKTDTWRENPNADWFGSPAIAMTKRQKQESFDESLLFKPKASTKLARSIVEFLRIIFPQSVLFCGAILFVAYAHDLVTQEPLHQIILQLPFYYLFFLGIPALVLSIAIKWILVGSYQSRHLPMWTFPVWRSEAVTTTTEALAVPYLLEFLKGTPWLPLIFRLYGTKVGKRVWMNTTDITEYDLVSIGDEAEFNADSGPQTHLFEDRIMKMGKIKFDNRVTIGSRSIVLYDTHIQENANIGSLSLVMKNEVIPANTQWTGSPVERKK